MNMPYFWSLILTYASFWTSDLWSYGILFLLFFFWNVHFNCGWMSVLLNLRLTRQMGLTVPWRLHAWRAGLAPLFQYALCRGSWPRHKGRHSTTWNELRVVSAWKLNGLDFCILRLCHVRWSVSTGLIHNEASSRLGTGAHSSAVVVVPPLLLPVHVHRLSSTCVRKNI